MTKTYLFYATGNDLCEIAERAESVSRLKYVRFGIVTALPPETFDGIAHIPNLGKASHPSAVGCESFLICDSQITINPRQLNTLAKRDIDLHSISIGGKTIAMDRRHLLANIGKNRFAIDQLNNPDTIVFTPGGMWNEDILLHGKIGTASKSRFSRDLMERFGARLESQFTKVKAFYVGPKAMDLLKQGMRLTIAAQSPREFDLRIT